MLDKSMSILLKKKLQEQNKPVKNRKWQNKLDIRTYSLLLDALCFIISFRI